MNDCMCVMEISFSFSQPYLHVFILGHRHTVGGTHNGHRHHHFHAARGMLCWRCHRRRCPPQCLCGEFVRLLIHASASYRIVGRSVMLLFVCMTTATNCCVHDLGTSQKVTPVSTAGPCLVVCSSSIGVRRRRNGKKATSVRRFVELHLLFSLRSPHMSC